MPASPTWFHDLANGKQRGVWAGVLRGGLCLAELPYAFLVRRRNRGYDLGRRLVEQLDVPVVSVGNLTVGGTGKTPFVQWLARWFAAQGVRVGIISRGYGGKRGKPNDEALELSQNLPDVPHLQDANRVKAGRFAIEHCNCQLILLDDGFQHRRLHRDLDMVLLDALAPFGYGRLLPRGLLREPPSGLARAHVVCLSRADLIEPEERAAIREQVQNIAPDADWVDLAHRPQALRSSTGDETPVASLAGKPVAAFCGIGNPTAFRRTLEGCGYEVAKWREYPDHYRYTDKDRESLARWAAQPQLAGVVCTHKDLVKIDLPRLGETPLWALRVEIDVLAGLQGLEERCQALISPPAS